MSEDPLVMELRVACASLVAAVASGESRDWASAERATLDAQERTARILRELALKLAAQSRAPPGVIGDGD